MTDDQAFCCEQVRPQRLQSEYYRLGLFIYWATAKNKQARPDGKNPGLDVPFCVQLFRRPYKTPRMYVPIGWGEFAEIDRKLLADPWMIKETEYYDCKSHSTAFMVRFYERTPIQSPVQQIQSPGMTKNGGTDTLGSDHGSSPGLPTSSSVKALEQCGCSQFSSKILKGKARMTEDLESSKIFSAQTGYRASTFGLETSSDDSGFLLLMKMPAGQYVLDLIESANEGMPARLVYSARSQRLRMLVCEELRKLSRSVDQNFPVWMGVFATQQIAKLIICYDPLDEYAKENTERILNATASAVKKVLYHNYGHRVYNDNSDEIVEILHEISRQNPHNGHLQSLVGRTLKTMVEGMKSEMDEQTLTEQIERKLRSSIDDDDSYDHCTESSSVDIPSDSTF